MARFLVPALVLLNVTFAVVANTSFKLSATAPPRQFLFWQVIGNISGLVTVLTLTALLRFIPLNLAWAITGGLGFMAVQVFASRLILNETITQMQWMGVVLISLGIILVAIGR